LKKYLRFLVVWAVNSCIILLANNCYRSNFVLGNAVMTPIMAVILTGFLLTIFLRFAKSFSKKFSGNRYKMFGYYFMANAVGIWILARLSAITGFGISAFYWAFYLGLGTSLGQWVTRQVFKKFKLN